MTAVLILCRHGNTFATGEKVVMVGAHQDLPLTDEGMRQASDVGAALRGIATRVRRIISGPLKRTKVYADVLKRSSGISASISIDERLIELDYGAWNGLSNDEIVALSGEESLREWHERGIRPAHVQFSPSESSVTQEVSELLRESERHAGVTVIVTSNGRLREFRRLAEASSASTGGQRVDGKVRTGGSCVLVASDRGLKIIAWNCDSNGLEVALSGL